MKKLSVINLLFVLGVLLATWQGPTIIRKAEFENDRHDSPEEFIAYHRGIRTMDGMNAPAYEDNYQWKELGKARSRATKFQAAARTNGANGVIEWKERGPGNIAGRTRGLIVDPDDPTHNTWYAGSASGGIWKTTNGGTSWTWLTPDLPNLATTVLAMSSSNHNIIYAGTGEGFGSFEQVLGQGIFKSIDRGITWTFLDATAQMEEINRIIIDPTSANTVIAASNNGIYRTTDGGIIWTKVYTGVVQDLRATPNNFTIQYAARNGVGVLKSTDSGQTWALAGSGINSKGRIEIDVSPVKTDRIFASSQGTLSGSNSDLYISDNGGDTWSLVNLMLANKNLNYLGEQGWYDNTLVCDPYDQEVVYVGGIGIYRVQLTTGSTGSVVGSYSMEEFNTTSFINLVNFGAEAYQGKLDIGPSANKTNVEIRFGAGINQKAHRFMVPDGSTSGVPDANYTFQDYVTVPFQVWDVSSNRQLMVSFRDQDRNGEFNLYEQNTTGAPNEQSREYIYINNATYDAATPNPSIAINGGQQFQLMYNIWPTLKTGATWNPNSLPTSALKFLYTEVVKVPSTVTSVSDPYAEYDGKNVLSIVHPDHHNLVAIKENISQKTFRLLNANDGGIYVSQISATPGTTQGEWTKVSKGFNTSQFYGADKRPGSQQYFGGMQDNSTYFSPNNIIATATTSYQTNTLLSGDGFEVIWHNLDGKKMIGGSQYNNFSRSLDGGITWQKAINGLTLSGSSPDKDKFPFLSKLANSRQAPDILFTVGSEGVWKSTDFGGNWVLTPITEKWGVNTFTDIEVSRANANIIWTGRGMNASNNLHISKDGGKTFTITNNYTKATLGGITKLASHPTEENTAFAIFSIAKSPKILRTKDAGQTWEDISGFVTNNATSTKGFPDVAVYCLYVRPDNPKIMWAGTEIGIVESLDEGNSWNLITDFPNVSVWDMKGQDDEIVIATHGRGIWTALLGNIQSTVINPKIIALGTSPQSALMVKIELNQAFDSTQVWINSTKAGKLTSTTPGEYIIKIPNAPKGTIQAKLISYNGSAPNHSAVYSGTHLILKPYQTQYFNYFTSDQDLSLDKFSVQQFGSSNSALKTQSNYAINTEYISILKQPIVIGNEFPFFFYRDVALVEPGNTGSIFGQPEFKDFVVVEATKDGLTWAPIADGYNASFNNNWLSAYNTSQVGNTTLFVDHNIDLTTRFTVGDTLLFRMRLYSNSTITSWGWAIDDLYIQQKPTSTAESLKIESMQCWPNPSDGSFMVSYYLHEASPVDLLVYDLSGRIVYNQNHPIKLKGKHEEPVTLNAGDGLYLVKLTTRTAQSVQKIIVRK